MGQNLHHKSTVRKGDVEDLARRVHHIMINKVTEDNLLYDVWSNKRVYRSYNQSNCKSGENRLTKP